MGFKFLLSWFIIVTSPSSTPDFNFIKDPDTFRVKATDVTVSRKGSIVMHWPRDRYG